VRNTFPGVQRCANPPGSPSDFTERTICGEQEKDTHPKLRECRSSWFGYRQDGRLRPVIRQAAYESKGAETTVRPPAVWQA